MNERRKQLFGDSSLKVYSTTPAAGETEEEEFTGDWSAHRVWATTDAGVRQPTSAWQFQIVAAEDWETSQDFMLEVVAITIGTRRWKVNKVEQPIGESLVWKLKGQEQG